MAITVELTYEMAKSLGEPRFEINGVDTVKDALLLVRERFGGGEEFENLSRIAAVAVNGVLINHKRGPKTVLADGDTLAFVKAAAGG